MPCVFVCINLFLFGCGQERYICLPFCDKTPALYLAIRLESFCNSDSVKSKDQSGLAKSKVNCIVDEHCRVEEMIVAGWDKWQFLCFCLLRIVLSTSMCPPYPHNIVVHCLKMILKWVSWSWDRLYNKCLLRCWIQLLLNLTDYWHKWQFILVTTQETPHLRSVQWISWISFVWLMFLDSLPFVTIHL